jgi:hypothetical protein
LVDQLGIALQAAARGAARAGGASVGSAGGALVAAGAAPLPPLERALLIGAGGRLGSALLAELLVAGRFESVSALVAAPLASTVRGLRALTLAEWAQPVAGTTVAFVAFVVFERERHSNGRDDAFVMPQPDELFALAQRLHRGGVRRLLLVLPHASSMLPAALSAGFASEAEAAVAGLGFEQLVLVKPSQDAAGAPPRGALARLARWWLSQLRWMVPQREQPLRAEVLARLVAAAARQLPRARAGTHVLSQALMSQAAGDDDGGEARLRLALAGSSEARRDAAATAPGRPRSSAPR